MMITKAVSNSSITRAFAVAFGAANGGRRGRGGGSNISLREEFKSLRDEIELESV